MRLPFATLAALSTWCFAGLARSYQIDAGCGANAKWVRTMVNSAFAMANLASASVKEEPINENANWLGKLLFNMQDAFLKNQIEGGFDRQPVNAQGVTRGILSFELERTGALDQLSKSEVVIFCTTDRLTKSSNPPGMLDSVAGGVMPGSNDGCSGTDSTTFMWTYNWADSWDTIQICPWFLEYAIKKKFDTTADITSNRAKIAVKGLDKLISNVALTPIDLFSLWDKVMLHEFMHTKAGGCRDDVGKSPYGWKNARKLAASGGTNNCDSWALFGSAHYWDSQGSPIDEDGKFTQGPPPSARRWLGSGAGMAWDVTKAEAVKRFF